MNLFFFLASLFDTMSVGRTINAVSDAVSVVDHTTTVLALDRGRYWASLDLNPELDAMREKDGKIVYALKLCVVTEKHLKDETQGWALGPMLLKLPEWTMLHEFLEIDAQNRANKNPKHHQHTGINGPRIVEVGQLRYQDPELRAQAA